MSDFQPAFLGMPITFQGEGDGIVTDETETDIFIESGFFTGWMSKAEFWEAIGVDD